MRRLQQLMLIAGLAAAATPLSAQSTRERLDALEARATQLEAILQGAALVELSQSVEMQASELRALRGELEQLQQALVTLRREQTDVARDVERRLAALEAAAQQVPATPAAMPETPVTEPAAISTPSIAETSVPVALPEVLYGQGFDALKAGRYPEAIETLKSFLKNYPVHPLADNAAYWLGQTYYVTREFALAVEAFAAVRERSSDPRKAPDALLKKGLCEIELQRTVDARASFEAVIARYPESEAATEARSRLERLR